MSKKVEKTKAWNGMIYEDIRAGLEMWMVSLLNSIAGIEAKNKEGVVEAMSKGEQK